LGFMAQTFKIRRRAVTSVPATRATWGRAASLMLGAAIFVLPAVQTGFCPTSVPFACFVGSSFFSRLHRSRSSTALPAYPERRVWAGAPAIDCVPDDFQSCSRPHPAEVRRPGRLFPYDDEFHG
jgi:hypothetical protein